MAKHNTQGATAPLSPSDSQHEATKEALRQDLEAGKCGVLGAIATYSNLSIQTIVAVAADVVRERKGIR